MIDATDLTKRFGDKVAVDNLTFTVRSGVVTGFLGPNGAGKSTTMRLILGLDHPTSGQTRINGRIYQTTKAPMTEVGALLEAKSVHPGRTARNHLRALAATHGIPRRRVDEVIDLVGLGHVATKRVGQFSLGMGQRLGLAAALLGDPETLILDEPVNGLDPEGVAWVRNLLRYLAAEGRTVFISSHLMSEMAVTADHIIIIGRGRLIADSPVSDLISQASGRVVKVRSPNAAEIADVVQQSGRQATLDPDGSLLISGLTPEAIGREAARRAWILYELTPIQRSLEDVYLQLTDAALEFQAGLSLPGAVRPPEGAPVHQAQQTISVAPAEQAGESGDTSPVDRPPQSRDASMAEPTVRYAPPQASRVSQGGSPRSRVQPPHGPSRLEQVRAARAALAEGRLTRTQSAPGASATRPPHGATPSVPATKSRDVPGTSAQRLRDMSVLDQAYRPSADAQAARARDPLALPPLNSTQETENATRRAWVREPRAVPPWDVAHPPEDTSQPAPGRKTRRSSPDEQVRGLADPRETTALSESVGLPETAPAHGAHAVPKTASVRGSRGSTESAPAREPAPGARKPSVRGSRPDQRDEQENGSIHVPPLDLTPRMSSGLGADQGRGTRPGSVYEQVMGFADGPASAPYGEPGGGAPTARRGLPPPAPGREPSSAPPAGSSRKSAGVPPLPTPRGPRGTPVADQMPEPEGGTRRSSTRASRNVAAANRTRETDGGSGMDHVAEFHAVSMDEPVMGLGDLPSMASGRRSRDLPPVVSVSEPDGVSLVDPDGDLGGGSRRSRTRGSGAIPPVVSVSEPRVMSAMGEVRPVDGVTGRSAVRGSRPVAEDGLFKGLADLPEAAPSRRSRGVPPVDVTREPVPRSSVRDARPGFMDGALLGSARTAGLASASGPDARTRPSSVGGSAETSPADRLREAGARTRAHHVGVSTISFDGRLTMPSPGRGSIPSREYADGSSAGSAPRAEGVPRPQRMRDFDAISRRVQARVAASASATPPRNPLRDSAVQDRLLGSAGAPTTGQARLSRASAQPEPAQELSRTTRPRPTESSRVTPGSEAARARLSAHSDTDGSRQPGQAWRVRRAGGGQ